MSQNAACLHKAEWICSQCGKCSSCCEHIDPEIVHINTKAAAEALHRHSREVRERTEKLNGNGR